MITYIFLIFIAICAGMAISVYAFGTGGKRKRIFQDIYFSVENADGIGVIYTKTGEYSAVLKVENPVQKYCANIDAYYEFTQLFTAIAQTLGEGYALHKQDIFVKKSFEGMNGEEREFLSSSYFRYFNGRPYTDSECYLTITQESKKSSLFSYDSKKWRDILVKIRQVHDQVRDAGVQHYAIYLLCGIVIFNGFNDCCNQAMRAIISNASLITKVYVPKYIYPVTKVLSASINMVLSMVPLLLVTIFYGLFNGLYIRWSILLLPLALIFVISFAVGMGFLLSSLMVFFHDVEFLWGVISTMWMYATPIIYSTGMLERSGAGWLAKVMQFNPLYHYVTFVRTIIIDGCSPAISEYFICAICSLVMIIIGGTVFKKTQDQFVLYI